MNISPKNLAKLEEAVQAIIAESLNYRATVGTYRHDVKEDIINLRNYVDDFADVGNDHRSTASFFAEDLAGVIHDFGQIARKK